MSINNLNTYLNIRDAHLRVVSGNVYAQAMNIGGINVETAHGLQSVSNTGNVTSNTLQFSNATTGFVTTANAQIGRDLVVTGNATVSTDLTVSANATVTDTLTISEHLIASKEATVTGNLHVTTIRSDSNVVTEYTGPHDRPLRKYPEVALTANSDKGYVASASSSMTSSPAYLAFDGSTSTTWWHTQYPYYTENGGVYDPGNAPGATGTYSGTLPSHELVSGYAGEYITLGLPNKIKMSKISINTRVDSTLNLDQTQSAEVIVVVGSHDGSTWEFVDTHTVGKYPDDNTIPYTFNVNTSTYYEHVGLICTNTGPTDSVYNTAWSVANLAFYGYEEGSGSLDTTLKTVYNVPATTGTQLEVYYDGQDYTQTSDFAGPGGVIDKAGGDQDGTAGTGVGFDSTYKAFTFDGSATGKIEGTHNFGTDTSPVLTMSFWMKRTAVVGTGWNYVATIGTSTTGQMIGLTINPGSQFNFSNYNDGTLSAEPILLNQWYHVTLVANGEAAFNSTNFKMYINGKEPKLSGHGGGSTTTLTGNQLTLGTNTNSGEAFNGSIANFRLYSKALNADQVKELYDYQKDYFLGSKSQVTLYKGHLGVGVTEPSGQLELAGDERIQEYPPRGFGVFADDPDYSTYIEGHGVFTAYGSSQNNTGKSYSVIGAFDKTVSIDSSCWLSGTGTYSGGVPTSSASKINGVSGEWCALQCPYPIKLKSFTTQVRAGNVNENARMAKSGIIWGSNDGATWYQVHSWSGKVYSDANPNHFQVNSTEYYSHHALQTTEIQGNADATVIGEWRLFGTPGPTILDKGSLSLTRSLDVPRVSRYDVDTETPRYEKLVVDFDTTVNSSPTDISGRGNHGTFYNGAYYSAADKAFKFVGVDNASQAANSSDTVRGTHGLSGTQPVHSQSVWFKQTTDANDYTWVCAAGTATNQQQSAVLLSGNSGLPNRITFDNYNGWVTSTVTAELNRWYHVVVTYNGGGNWNTTNCRIYVDGVDCTGPSSETHNEQPLNLQGSILALGSTHNGTRGLTGLVSNYKLYDVVLEPSEVKKLYNLGRTGRSMVISDTAVGIGKVPEAQLDVRGNLNVEGVITNQQRPAFYVWRDGTGNSTEIKNTTGVITNWDSKRIDTAGTFDLSNGRYYIPVSGLYNFVGAGLYRYNGSGNGILEVSFYVNGSNVNVRGISYNRGNTTNEHHTVTITFMRFMNAGDYVQMGIYDVQTACDLYYGDGLGYFSGYLLG